MALTGALLLTSAPIASADAVRDAQWPLTVYDAERVWKTSQGEGVTVAVVDSGVDATQVDLTGQVLPGKDFNGDDPHKDSDGHGTGMASVIAGHGHGANGSRGVMGLAPKAKILPVRADAGGEMADTWPDGVRYAVDHGAKVINLSFIDTSATPGTKAAKAIAYAQEHDAVVVAGAGNDTGNVNYPAALPGVVAVTAVDKNLDFWGKSNTGKGVVLAAPGVDIPRATGTSDYAKASGTSDATAYVSAIAALVRSKYPDLTAGQVINRLIKSASFLQHEGKKAPDSELGYGIARPGSALTMDIPKGSKEGPLAQASPSTSTNSGAASDDDSTSVAKKKTKSSSGSTLLIAGIAAGVVVIAILFAVIRSRRNRGGGGPGSGGGNPSYGTGYPSQPPTGYQPYPNTAPNQAYPTPPGQSPQHPNPYAQQPPHQGQ
ncbi:S8 family serine peptidase [Streptomyces sp. NBC_01728]|uniref:S8 family serine peptidase n=1 Tax=unclassified Streptomyces TaxID=2593676 RepID=UPI00224CB47F|nr:MULTISPECIES: S8 family serine peptidase [unclassified Streptomyces]MCX4457229.1 S8 family serine peptidase [Streptomyces sp. NBC_01719]MCX4496586.1 S8 family serine peptidase [Streptomyces sp. NBC_01728]